MNRNRKTSKSIKQSGNRKELEMLLENCKYKQTGDWCSYNNALCYRTIKQGNCKVIIDYSKTHTLGDIK